MHTRICVLKDALEANKNAEIEQLRAANLQQQVKKIPARMAKETHAYGKRDPLIWQKRPAHMAKETHSYGKRDPPMWYKRLSFLI